MDGIGNRPQGAEIGPIGDGTENKCKRESQPGNFSWQKIEILHRAIISCAPHFSPVTPVAPPVRLRLVSDAFVAIKKGQTMHSKGKYGAAIAAFLVAPTGSTPHQPPFPQHRSLS